MKSTLRAVAIVAILFASFAANAQKKPTTALELNDYFASINDSLFAGGQKWGTAFGTASASKDFSGLKANRIALQNLVSRKKKELTAMKDIAGSLEFRQAMINFLEFEGQLITEAFLPFEKITAKTPQADIDVMIANLNKIAANESEKINEIRVTQAEYGKKNGFNISEN